METLVVQAGVRHGRIAEVTRSRGDRLSIGRSYDNDLVITDLHVAPRQVEFRREEGEWRLFVLDRTNPVFVNDRKVVEDSVPVSSGDRVTLGRTRLSVHASDSPVEKTRKLMLANLLGRDSGGILSPLLFLVLVVMADFALTYFEGATDLEWVGFASDSLFAVVIVFVWAGLWALAGRLMRHQHHLGLQLMATSAAVFLSTPLFLGFEYLSYPFHNPTVLWAFYWAAAFLTLALLFHFNLAIATNLRRTLLTGTAMSVLVIGVLIGFEWFSENEDDWSTLQPEYSATLVPPPFGLGATSSADSYFEALQQ